MVIFECIKKQEDRADKVALDTMIPNNVWKKIVENHSEENIKEISKENRIPISFMVGRMAKVGLISYKSRLYNNYCLK